jgi:hypothetical protein
MFWVKREGRRDMFAVCGGCMVGKRGRKRRTDERSDLMSEE